MSRDNGAQWLPRCALGWLLAAQLALIAPHVARLPVWVIGIWLVAAGWRVMVLRGRWSLPSRWLKVVLLLGAVAGIRWHYGSWVGLEPTVALLISCFCFKLLEAVSRRDAYLLLCLGYFVAVTQYLFESGIFSALYMLLPLLLLTSALVALHWPARLGCGFAPLRSALLLSVQALPLMLLLFLVVPRFGPLWQVPLPSQSARTGISDEMAPGDIAELSRSAALAFRAVFEQAPPPQPSLYWRGLVFDQFDGRSWHPGRYSDAGRPAPGPEAMRGEAVDYAIYLEPTQRHWLFALERPLQAAPRSLLTYDYRLITFEPVRERFHYQARAWPDALLDTSLEPRLRQRNLQLPAAGNPRARALAARLREAHGDDGEALAQALLRHFREQPFVYTLRPPLLGGDSVDEFLFDSRRGFCEHYAGAFTFLLRAAEIPARVVVGYQGGEVNPLNGTVLVHQFDAHAWVEVWLPERGWVRFDPTAAVAPNRVEQGLEQALEAGEFLADSPLSPRRYSGIGLVNQLRLQLDTLNYNWTRWVLNYRDDTQTALLQRLLGGISPWRMGLFLLGGGALVLGVVALLLFGRRRAVPLTPELRLYRRLCRRLARRGYPRPQGMAAGEYARWVLAEQPDWGWVMEATDCFEALSYRPLTAPQQRALLRRLRQLVRTGV